MGLLYGIRIRIINFLVFFLIVILLPLPPKTQFGFTSFNVTPSKELKKGSLELNNFLDNAERLLDGRVYGPECIVARKNEIYTGIHGGEIIKITADHITHVAKFGQPCEGIYEESKCGRPLGLAFDTIGNNLIVADAYYGIWQVDLGNGKKKQLITPHQILDGTVKRHAKIFNSVTVDKKGDIYWTDSSSDFAIEDGVLATLANPSGRLFHYDRSKNISNMLLDQLYFPNGVALSPNEEYLIFAETGSSKLTKYFLQGTKRGQAEVFLDGLPGIPDNLTPDNDGLWVPLVAGRDIDHPQIFQILAPFPLLRLFLVRVVNTIEIPFRILNNAIPNIFAQKLLHLIGNFESVNIVQPTRATILRVDWNGNIKGSLHGFDRSVGFVSHVLELDDSLLLGSPFNKFIGKVKLPKGPQVKIRNVRYEGAGEHMEPIVIQKTTKPIEAKKPLNPSTATTTNKPNDSAKVKPNIEKPILKPVTQPPTKSVTQPPTKPVTQPPPKPPSPKPTKAPAAKHVPTTSKPTTTEVPKVKPTTIPKSAVNSNTKKDPAPIEEQIPKDTQPPKKEKLKVIKKGGIHEEL